MKRLLHSKVAKFILLLLAILSGAGYWYGCMPARYTLSFHFKQQDGERISIETDSMKSKFEGFYMTSLEDTSSIKFWIKLDQIETFGKIIMLDTSQVYLACEIMQSVKSKTIVYGTGKEHREADKVKIGNKGVDNFIVLFNVRLDLSKLKNIHDETVTCHVKFPMYDDDVDVRFNTETLKLITHTPNSILNGSNE